MRTNNHAFINQFFLCTLFTICFSGSIGLGTVWMRHQISLTANANKVLEAAPRRIGPSTSRKRLPRSRSSKRLRSWNNATCAWGYPWLRPVVQDVRENPTLHLASKASRGLLTDRVVPVSFRLASRN